MSATPLYDCIEAQKIADSDMRDRVIIDLHWYVRIMSGFFVASFMASMFFLVLLGGILCLGMYMPTWRLYQLVATHGAGTLAWTGLGIMIAALILHLIMDGTERRLAADYGRAP